MERVPIEYHRCANEEEAMPRPSENPNYAYEPEETPLLKVNPDFWWMNEVNRSNAFEKGACLRWYGLNAGLTERADDQPATLFH
jgi:hypothetical protein